MTYEEAKDVLINITVQFGRSQGKTQFVQAWEKALEAIDKQIPKKPSYVDTRFRHHGRNISDGCSLCECYKCPTCGRHIFHVFDSEKHCIYCGQALDWSDTE